MAKEKWSLVEEQLLVEYFFICKKESRSINAKDGSLYLVETGFPMREPSKVRAKLNDIKRIDKGYDLSHVAKNTIKAYQTSPLKPSNPFFKFERPEKEKTTQQSVQSFTEPNFSPISTNNFLSANNPFRNAQKPVINQLRPSKDFYEYLEELLYELHNFDRLTWSTIYTNAEINHTTANKLRRGEIELTRDYLFRLLIAMRLSKVEEAFSLIAKSGLSFRLQEEPDFTVKTAILNKIYDRKFINEYLIDSGYAPLFPKLAKQLNQI